MGKMKTKKKVQKICAVLLSLIMLAITVIEVLPNNVKEVEAALNDHTVSGVSPRGTTINLFDYWINESTSSDATNPSNYRNMGINAGNILKFTARAGNETGLNKYTGDKTPQSGMVYNTLQNGYPMLKENTALSISEDQSLNYLFNSSSTSSKQAYMDVKNLLQISDDGYYYYNSQENFASFDKTTNSFVLYDTWAVKKSGKSPNGQFFPFNTANDVFTETGGNFTQKNINSKNSVINHYFGVSMTTRFMQVNGGYTDENHTTPITYEFSGDDDVWIFIDDVLVADLGGIHDMASVSIDFSTGAISINDGEATTLREVFEAAGRTWGHTGNTFDDNTLHTLNFFYLERGNVDSNMSLKFNLVSIPESEIIKVDQLGNPIEGMEFELYTTDENYTVTNGATPIATGITDEDGKFVLKDQNEELISFDILASKGYRYFVLKETSSPAGYRSAGDMHLKYYHPQDDSIETATGGVLLADNPWEVGAYATSKFQITMPDTLISADDSQHYGKTEIANGTVFAVVLRRMSGLGTTLEEGQFYPVGGNHLDGWTVATGNSMADIVKAAQESPYVFEMNASGSYEALINELPGDIKTYYHMVGEADRNNTQMAIGYYYTTASDIAGATDSNTVRLQNPIDNPFEGIYSSNIYYANKKNYLFVQKYDDQTTPQLLNGATFELYAEDSIEFINDVATIKQDAVPYDTTTTQTYSGILQAEGTAVFPTGDNLLVDGVYYLVEKSTLEGYKKNEQLVKVIVDSTGVYADAGVVDDGIKVARGVGSLVESMAYFAIEDNIDATLHDIQATLQAGTYDESTLTWTWTDATPSQIMHLNYDVEGKVLEYGPQPGTNSTTTLVTDEGWAALKIEQCYGNGHGASDDLKINLAGQDLTNLFTGTAVVQVTNERIGALEVSKTVTGADAPEDAQFDFLVTLQENTTPITGTFPCTITETSTGNLVTGAITELTFNENGEATFQLMDNQTITINQLPENAAYTVKETNKDIHWATTVNETNDEEATGIIQFNQTVQAAFINDYVANPVEWSLTVTKTLTGDTGVTLPQLTENMFQFVMWPEDNANPMPEGSAENIETGYVEKTVGNDADTDNDSKATVSFGTIQFVKSGVYTYFIDEIITSANGITSDTSHYKVTVSINNNAGTLEIGTVTYEKFNSEGTSQGMQNEASFVNLFTPSEATVYLRARKFITNTVADTSLSIAGYEFKITPISGTDENNVNISADNVPMPQASTGVDQTIIVSADNGRATSLPITYDVNHLDHTYVYQINEVVPEGATQNDDGTYRKNGITYDNSIVTATVKILQGIDGLTAQVTYTDDSGAGLRAAGFTNVYSALETYSPAVNKTLNGRDGQAGEFSFTIAESDNNDKTGYTMPANNSVSVNQLTDGVSSGAQFDAITFTKAGTYVFTITENIPQDAENNVKNGITYDSSSWTVTVTVTDNGDGTLTTAGQYTNGNESNILAASYVNNYSASGTATIEGNKILQGRNWLQTDTFQFEMQPTAETQGKIDLGIVTMPNYSTVLVHGDEGLAVGKGFTFQPITFNEEGQYTFTVNEVEPGQEKISGIDYDTTVYTVTITMTDNGQGTLTPSFSYATATNPNVANITFTNRYGASGTTSIEGTKVLTGRDWLDTDAFTFVLEGNDDTTNQAIANGAIILPGGGTTAQSTVQSTTPDHKFSFSDIQFNGINANETKQYEFKITEKEEGIANVNYDSHEAIVTVTVVGGIDGTAEVTTATTVAGSLTFTNEYVPTPTDVTIGGTKELSGRTLQNGEFEFTIEKVSMDGKSDIDSLNQMPTATPNSVFNDSTGKFIFSAMTFTQKGTYVYRVKEVQPIDDDVNQAGNQKDGVTYDEKTYLITIQVTDNNQGTLTATTSYIIENGTLANAIVFNNAYYANPVSTTITGTKTVVVVDGSYTLAQDDFYFEISADAGTPETTLTGNTIVSNALDGSFTFSGISFTVPGKYSYNIRELNNKQAGIGNDPIPGMSYDGTIYTVTYVVEDDGKGQLVILDTQITNEQDIEVANITFENTYNATSVSGTGGGVKVLNGRTLNAGEFSFKLEPKGATLDALNEGKIVFKDNKQALLAVNSKRGTFSFGTNAITFNEVGDYEFTVSEVAGTDSTITYDTKVYTVIAHITDVNGVLQLRWELEEGVTRIAFTNTYTPAPVTTSIIGSKILEGRKLNANEFEFTIEKEAFNGVKDEQTLNSMPIPANATVTNSETGEFVFTFAQNAFTKEGTYTYRISEVSGTQKGVTYSNEQYLVIIEVIDNNGQLQVVTTFENSIGNPVDSVEFVNAYKAEPTAVTLGAFKQLEGRSLQTGEFTFELKDESGAIVRTAKNSENGSINFEEITYDTVGTYKYTISEIKENKDNIIYDNSIYSVLVTVTDGLDGYLKAKVSYENEIPLFVNSYTPPETTTEESSEITTETETEGSSETTTETETKESSETITETATEEGSETTTETATEESSETTTESTTEEVNEDGENVNTGDNNKAGLYITLAIISLTVIGIVVLVIIKSYKEK